jgi:hypothetical protein
MSFNRAVETGVRRIARMKLSMNVKEKYRERSIT